MDLANTNIERINTLHKEIESAFQKSLNNAIEIGQILTSVKKELPHGEFGNWIDANCFFSARTARRYITLYTNRDKLTGGSSIQEAYKILSAPKTDSPSEMEHLAEKLKEQHPELRLPEAGEVLTVMANKTLDPEIDKEEDPTAFIQVWNLGNGYFNPRIYKVGGEYNYEIYNKRGGVKLDSLNELVLFYSGNFPFSATVSACVEQVSN